MSTTTTETAPAVDRARPGESHHRYRHHRRNTWPSY
jgi:hypothetical protein